MRVVPAVLLTLASAAALGAQEARSRFGLGVTFNPGVLSIASEAEVVATQSGFNNLLVPIRMAAVTFEPEIGITRMSTERRFQTGPTTFTTQEVKTSFTRIGAGLLKHLARRDNLEPYLAPRIGFVFVSSKIPQGSSTVTTKATNLYLTGAAGGQYFLANSFSMGGEAQLTYTKLGKPKVTGTTFTSPEESGSTITTLGVVTIRWYY